MSQGFLVLFPYTKATPSLVFSKLLFLICVFAGLLVDQGRPGSMFLFGALLAAVLHHLILWFHREKALHGNVRP